jgi:hypothetical protein
MSLAAPAGSRDVGVTCNHASERTVFLRKRSENLNKSLLVFDSLTRVHVEKFQHNSEINGSPLLQASVVWEAASRDV